MADWLDDFLSYSSGGESPPKYMFWVGVVTIAAVLRRKVWIDQVSFQWTPNFYVLLVGPPGIKKTTAINIGFNLLKRVDSEKELNFGPQIITWQQLVTHMAEARKKYVMPDGEIFPASCVSIKIGEFGTFFDPLNRELVDNLTNIWDSAIDTIKKETRTMGSDEIVNPWLNIIAGTTPDWIEDNFSTKLIGGGFASRPVYLYEDTAPKDIAYPSRVPNRREKVDLAVSLVKRLDEYADLAGEFEMSEDAFAWGEDWYCKFRTRQRAMSTQEAAFCERQQAHLHKLAMVLCVARGGFPLITVEDMKVAEQRLIELEPDVATIFARVGRTRMSKAAGDILAKLKKVTPITRSKLYFRYFFNTMSSEEFDIAFASVKAAGLVEMSGPLEDVLISLKEDDEKL